ncbi:MAG TPA: flagellar motor protein MotB [Holophaga sp.]|nr:flagellar motor protein MotB [Holophaga sp.]
MAKVTLRALRRRGVDFESLWLITFADLMVQLMAFFAVVYSFSMQGQEQMGQLVKSLQKALGVKVAGTELPGGPGILPGSTGIGKDRAADLEKLLADMKASSGPDEGVRMRIVTFRGSILFDEGSAVVDTAFQPLMTRISRLVGEYPGFTLICEGHAAPGERSKAGGDALELSGQRAQAIVRFLALQGLDMKTIAAEAHGDAQVDGDPSSPEGRSLQRRVVFRFQRVAER